MKREYDIAIIGGGINGCGIARDAAGRGLKVLLCEQGDLASAASSASTKLIHGGLRYLEYGEFRLVRESLRERERLLGIAPHLIRPMRFILPHRPEMRPAWLIRLGLLLYDRLGGRRVLPPTRRIHLADDARGTPLVDGLTDAFEYSDCWVDDARLTVLNAVDAAERGADVLTRARFLSARRETNRWRMRVRMQGESPGEFQFVARALINASGIAVNQVRAAVLPDAPRAAPLRMVRGSHIVVPQLFEGEHAYILQNRDKRVIFAIPFEGRYTLIGTTEQQHARADGDDNVDISEVEVEYLLRAIGDYFRAPCKSADIAWSYSGVRPLFDDGAGALSAVTRDYVLSLDQDAPPLLNIIGGKLTTYRKLAENALDKLAPFLPAMTPAWSGDCALPGGDFARADIDSLATALTQQCQGLPAAQAMRLVRAYGTRARQLLGDAQRIDELGEHFGGGLYAREVAHLMRNEWAHTADDVLWRRSKIGLHINADAQVRLAQWMAQYAGEARDGV